GVAEFQHRSRRQRLAVHREDRPGGGERPPGIAAGPSPAPGGRGRGEGLPAVLDGLPRLQPDARRRRQPARLDRPRRADAVELSGGRMVHPGKKDWWIAGLLSVITAALLV